MAPGACAESDAARLSRAGLETAGRGFSSDGHNYHAGVPGCSVAQDISAPSALGRPGAVFRAVLRCRVTARGNSLSVFVPAHNEAKNLEGAIRDVTAAAEERFTDYEILLLDD